MSSALRPQGLDGRTSRRGIALIATLGIVLVVGLLVLASAVTGVIDRSVSANQLRSNAAYYVALSGLEVYKTAIFRNLVDAYAQSGDGWCEVPIAGGIRGPDGTIILLPTELQPDGTGWVDSGNGQYRVFFDLISQYLVLTSEGRVADGNARVQLVAYSGGGPGSSWDNAILATGATPGSNTINGNVMVYGSVHIVDGDLDGSFALSGTAGVYNDYKGKNSVANSDIRSDLAGLIPNTDVDLCTRVKIAKGSVFLESGAVQLGTDLEPIYSIHLGAGNVCSQRQSNGGCSDENVVSNHQTTDRVNLRFPEGPGMSSPYGPFDLPLPKLSPEAFVRAFWTRDAETGDVVAGCEWLHVNTTSNAARLPPVLGGAAGIPAGENSTVCGNADNSIQWIADVTMAEGGYVEVKGTVHTWPDFEVRGPVKYSGMGSLLVGGDTTFGSSAYVQPRTPNTYPLTNALAIMSSGDITFGTVASGEPSAVMLYAGGSFIAERQVTIVGGVIANDFNLGRNVPKIAYHPDVRIAAEVLCLPGTACAGDGLPPQRGTLSDIAFERR